MINVSRLYCGIENSSDRFRYHSQGHPAPIIVYNCTRKCSQNCLHCYSRTGKSESQLDTQQAIGLLNQLAENNCAVILFSGGEPLERPDLFELLDYSHKLGLRTVLSTNGNLIDSQIATKLAAAGVDYVGISIDGDEKTHDSFRQVLGSFKKVLNAVKACKDVSLKVGLRFTITNRNCNQINEIFSLAEKLEIQRICFYHLILAGAARNNLKCTNHQIRQALSDIFDCSKEYMQKGVTEVLTVGNHADGPYILTRLKNEYSPLYEKSLNLLEKFGGNKIGTKIFDIDSAGNVHPDQFWQNFSLGNITEIKLEEIIKKSLNLFKDRTTNASDRCKKCKWLTICGTNMREGRLEPDCYLNDNE